MNKRLEAMGCIRQIEPEESCGNEFGTSTGKTLWSSIEQRAHAGAATANVQGGGRPNGILHLCANCSNLSPSAALPLPLPRKFATHLVAGKLCEQVGIVGEGLDGYAGAIIVNSQQLGPVGREGDLLDAIGLDELEEVRIADRGGCSARRLDDLGDGARGGGRRRVHSHGEGRCRRGPAVRRRRQGCEGLRRREEEGGDEGNGKPHGYLVQLWENVTGGGYIRTLIRMIVATSVVVRKNVKDVIYS